MRIDLRYPLVVGAFYAPGTLVLIGGFLLGYSLEEIRDAVAFAGALFGGLFTIFTTFALFTDGQPIWLTLWEKEGDQ